MPRQPQRPKRPRPTQRPQRTRYIGLLRGVNVGGNKRVSMAELRAVLEKAGFEDVRTLLQSGNVIFTAPVSAPSALESRLESAIETGLKIDVDFHVRTAGEWREIIEANPFVAEARTDPARLLVTCYKAALDPAKVEALQTAMTGPERLRAHGRHLYMTFPDGMGNSKAAVLVGRALGRGTARNWNTVLKLAALV